MAGMSAGGQKPPDPMCPMCGSALAKSPAGLHVMSKVSNAMASKVKRGPEGPAQPRSMPGMSAPGVRRF